MRFQDRTAGVALHYFIPGNASEQLPIVQRHIWTLEKYELISYSSSEAWSITKKGTEYMALLRRFDAIEETHPIGFDEVPPTSITYCDGVRLRQETKKGEKEGTYCETTTLKEMERETK